MLTNFFKKKRKTIHLLHIGKTGGTSLTKMLQNVSSKKYIITIHPHEFSLNEIPKNELAIFFLRNPIDRFVSGFYSRKRKGQPTYNVPWNTTEEHAFNDFETPNQLAEALSSKDAKVLAKANDAMNGIRHVNTYFKDWIVSESYLKEHQSQIFFIGFQESFENDLKRLYKKMTQKNWVTDVVKTHQTSNTEDKKLTNTAKKNLALWYKEDINLYQFCKSLSQKVN